jgi:cytochrome P450
MPRTLKTYAAVAEALAREAEGIRLTQGDAAQATIRAAARDLFPAARLAAWRESLSASADALARSLAVDAPIDLMEAFAAPWSLGLAADVTGLSADDAARLNGLARTIFLDAANATAATVGERDTTVRLATALATLGSTKAIDVQSFVAISQTLPHLLVAAWHALFTHAEQIEIRRSMADRSTAIDELLRFAGPSRAVFRRDAGEQVALMLAEANRDPSIFANPDGLDLRRHNAREHLALGGGRHPCVGAPVIRLALDVATSALLARVDRAVAIEDVRWLDGFAIRAPSSLVVRV